MTIRLAPSILSADFADLGREIAAAERGGADLIHVDVMDGHFVPPITMGPLAVEAIAEQVHDAGAQVDVHLMIESPERQIEAFAKAGADSITFHFEATPHAHYALQAIAGAGCSSGLALNPGTPADAVRELTPDMVLCMTVNPGWGGQEFLEPSLAKLERLRALIGPDTALEVDGGIDADTAGRCAVRFSLPSTCRLMPMVSSSVRPNIDVKKLTPVRLLRVSNPTPSAPAAIGTIDATPRAVRTCDAGLEPLRLLKRRIGQPRLAATAASLPAGLVGRGLPTRYISATSSSPSA